MSQQAEAAVEIGPGLVRRDPPALLGGECSTCGARMFPRRPWCPECQSPSVEEVALASRGTVYTFGTVRAAPPGYAGEVPYSVGIVELAEDRLRVTATLIPDEPDALRIGAPAQFELLELPGPEGPILSFAYRVTGASR